MGDLLFLGMSPIIDNIKSFIVVFSLCEKVVTNHFLNNFNTSPIYNSINTICIFLITFCQSRPIIIRSQTNISVIDRSVFHAVNGADSGVREAQIIYFLGDVVYSGLDLPFFASLALLTNEVIAALLDSWNMVFISACFPLWFSLLWVCAQTWRVYSAGTKFCLGQHNFFCALILGSKSLTVVGVMDICPM